MKKGLCFMTLAAILSCSLAACGNQGAAGSTAAGAATGMAQQETAETMETKTGGETKAMESSAGQTQMGASEDDPLAGADFSGDYRIDVILKTTSSEYWGYVVAGAKAFEKDHSNVKVDVKGASSETAYDEQQNIIETDLNAGNYDGYVIAPLQADLVKTLIAGHTKPILAVDTKIEAPEVLSFIGTSNETAAEAGGRAAVEAAKQAGWEKVEAICISGVQGDGTATARLNGYQTGIEGAGGNFLEDEIQYADAVADKAVTSMEAIMQNHPEGIAIICCHNDDVAIAAARAAASNEAYKNTVFMGFDGIKSACNAILEGSESISVAQEAYDMGYKSVAAAVAKLNGMELPEFINSGVSIVTPENAQERLDALTSYLGE